MKRLLAALFLLVSCSFAHAQDAYVVAICGAVPAPYTNVGAVLPITVDTNGKLCLSGGGGGGTPGGSNTQLQYNAAGSFGGISGATSNGTTVTFASSDLILSGATSGSAILNAPATGGGTLTLPAGSTTLAGLSVAETWTAVQTFNSGDLVLSGIASTQCLQANSSGVISGTGSACASGGTPAGPSSAVQFNNSGAFGGTANFEYVDPGQLTLALGSITTNLKALTITGTFNAAGVTFDAPLLLNVTNTASAAASLLADLQVGGSTFWDVNVQGQTQQAGLAWIKTQTGGVAFGNAFDASLSYAGANTLSVDNGNFNTATGTLKLANIVLTTSITGPNNSGTNGAGSNITETPALSTGGAAPGNWIVQNGFSGTGAAATATISNASPAVITEAAHNYFIGEPFTLTTTGTLPTGFSTLTTYYVISAGFGAGAFEASTSFGGAAVNTSTAGSGTHTVNPGGVVTISNASPAVVTLNNHGLVPGMQVQFSANGGTLPTGISAATNYFVISAGLTVNAFEVSTTLNGSAVNTSTAGSGTFTVLYQGGTTQNSAYAVTTVGPSQLTASLTTPAFQINQVWNTQGVPDAALLINATRVNSDFRAKWVDVQNSGTTIFQIVGAGAFVPGGGVGSGYWFGGPSQFGFNGFVGLTSGTASSGNLQFIINGAAYGEFAATGAEPFERLSVGNQATIGWVNATSGLNGSAQDTAFGRNAAGVVMLTNASTFTSPAGLQVYNTTDHVTGSVTNYERGVLDWTTTANQLTIGVQAGGTGNTGRQLSFVVAAGGTPYNWISGGTTVMTLNALTASLEIQSNSGFSWSSSSNAAASPDTALYRAATKVIEFSDGSQNANGWMQWGGQSRVTADVTNATTTLATITGLSVTVQAGRTYCFVGELSFTDAAAGGLQLAVSGTSTATNIIYDGYIVDSAANGTKGNAQATALGGVVASSVTTGTAGHARISGCDTVNAAGTLLLQFAENTSNATATTIKRGSYFYVYDSP